VQHINQEVEETIRTGQNKNFIRLHNNRQGKSKGKLTTTVSSEKRAAVSAWNRFEQGTPTAPNAAEKSDDISPPLDIDDRQERGDELSQTPTLNAKSVWFVCLVDAFPRTGGYYESDQCQSRHGSDSTPLTDGGAVACMTRN